MNIPSHTYDTEHIANFPQRWEAWEEARRRKKISAVSDGGWWLAISKFVNKKEKEKTSCVLARMGVLGEMKE